MKEGLQKLVINNQLKDKVINMNVKQIKSECNKAKENLIDALNELESNGYIKEAKQLENIIIKLEIWQNK